jgi:hypothetical protein
MLRTASDMSLPLTQGQLNPAAGYNVLHGLDPGFPGNICLGFGLARIGRRMAHSRASCAPRENVAH